MQNFHKRTFVKGLTWEGSGLIILFLIAYFGIYSNAISASIFTISYTVVRVGMYYIHERIWKRTAWGKAILKEKEKENV